MINLAKNKVMSAMVAEILPFAEIVYLRSFNQVINNSNFAVMGVFNETIYDIKRVMDDNPK